MYSQTVKHSQMLRKSNFFLNTGTQATKEEIQGLLILIKTVSELVQRRNQQRRPLSLEQNLFTLISALMYAMVPTTAYRLLGDGTQSRPGGSCFASKHGDVESQFEQYVSFFLYFTIFPCQNETHTHTNTDTSKRRWQRPEHKDRSS